MNGFRAGALLVLLAFMAACSPQRVATTADSSPTITIKVVPKPAPVGDPMPCDDVLPNKTCVVNVAVTVAQDVCTVTLKDYIKLGSLSDVNRIEWRLPTGFSFCTRGGDGAFLDNPLGNPPFDPDPAGPCKQDYAWKRNQLDNLTYGYFLRFRNDTNTLICVKDPFYKNG